MTPTVYIKNILKISIVIIFTLCKAHDTVYKIYIFTLCKEVTLQINLHIHILYI